MPEILASIRVRQARAADVVVIARLHRHGLPDSFLSSLGEGLLRRLYRSFVDDARAKVMVAEHEGAVVGFVAGAIDGAGLVRRHRLRAALAVLPRLARPAVLRRALETARYDPPTDLPAAELLAIAVDPAYRRSGVGRILATALLAEVRAMDAGAIKVVAGAANEGANRFYSDLGFRLARSIEVHRGEPSNVWVADVA